MFQQWLLLLAALWAIEGKPNQLVGPYDVEVHKIEKCPTSGSKDDVQWSLNIRHYNRTTTFISTNVTFPNGFSDSLAVTVDLAVLKNRVWRNNFINIRMDKACSDLRKLLPKMVSTFFAAAGNPITGCPVQAGTYNVLNWMFDITTASGVFPYNTYKINIKAFDSKNAVFCVVVEIEIIPKVQKP